ncbi:hypothetical protein CPB84DRAFT_1735217 [Gymnopilus junonius]|uniref:MYND-type domain-containing protein n=1 Tax=Gymnopilus junonius TaxID=109634 RepID=A0A9P5THG7_GYMJU|nr:hypothetical protein CPB84DRAFT_1735217 [Gymnopilus junonius]
MSSDVPSDAPPEASSDAYSDVSSDASSNAPSNSSSDSRSMDHRRVPPILVNLGLACFYCLSGRSAENSLSQCGCRHLWFCDQECQMAQWPDHQEFCTAYQAVERKYGPDLLKPYSFVRKNPYTHHFINEEEVEECLDSVGCLVMDKLEEELQRTLLNHECNVLGWEPHCLACGRSDAIFRIEARLANQNTSPSVLKPCPGCALSFFCCDLHWLSMKSKHQDEPSKYSRENLSHCEMNRRCFDDMRCSQILLPGSNVGEFNWVPERTVPSWSSLQDSDWTHYLSDLANTLSSHSSKGHDFLEAALRAVSENLSMPMTILWGLEILNGDDDSWTMKEVLNIHVIGAAEVEIMNDEIFEEILHRLPLVKTLMMTFVGPDLDDLTGEDPIINEIEICAQCESNGRMMIHDHHPKTYHEYIADQGSGFVKPDLAIAFNSVCCKGDIASWTRTYHAMFRQHIPSLFTAYNEAEAIRESILFKGAGITFHPELSPRRNPWGSLLSKMEPKTLTRFYEFNGWISGGWK